MPHLAQLLSLPLPAGWKSKVFPVCDASHVKHNEECGDNVGPLILEKDE